MSPVFAAQAAVTREFPARVDESRKPILRISSALSFEYAQCMNYKNLKKDYVRLGVSMSKGKY